MKQITMKQITRKGIRYNKSIGWFYDKETGFVKQVITLSPYKERIVGKLTRVK